ncbi:unnamed protein product [Caenorhabditis sp. 36 PRJEB53466]|nr:unnamed protein product [Caenorhabditis sp. 36 PRJEB53466]
MSGPKTNERSRDDDNEEVWKERCFQCIRCNSISDCRQCSACKNNKTCETRRCFNAKKLYDEKMKKQTEENLKQIMAKSAELEAQAAASGNNDMGKEPEKKKRGRKKGTITSKKIKEKHIVKSFPTRLHSADLKKKRTQLTAEPNRQPRQCLNPDCIYEARGESKYCSNECGKTLARMKLTEILPARCKEYFSVPRTHEEALKQKRTLLNKDMQNLTTSEKHMMRFIEKLHEYAEKLSKLVPQIAEEQGDDNMFEACVVCGQPDIPLKKYAKHIDLCWSRKQCLKICGYPKKWENSLGYDTKTLAEAIEQEDPFGEEGCMTRKDACSKHYKWLPSLRGSIELEQACLFQKMFELCHETHKLNTHAEWTTNVLSIFMHKPPNIVNQKEYLAYVKSMKSQPMSWSPDRSEAATDDDPVMIDTAQFLAGISVDPQASDSLEPAQSQNDLPSPSTSTILASKSNFSVSRFLE